MQRALRHRILAQAGCEFRKALGDGHGNSLKVRRFAKCCFTAYQKVKPGIATGVRYPPPDRRTHKCAVSSCPATASAPGAIEQLFRRAGAPLARFVFDAAWRRT
jgi:hypothetical protein